MEASTDGLILGDYAESIEGRQAKTVTVERNNGFEIRYAGGSVFFRSPEVNLEETRDFNFALLALILVSMSSGQAFHLSEPVTRSALNQVRRYARVLQVMKPKAFFSPVVICPNVIEDRPSARTESIICLSGGVDSTYASMIRQQGGWRIENVAVSECLKHDFWREVTGSPGGKLKPRQRITVENAKEIVTLYIVSVDDIKRRAQVVVEFTLEPDYSTTDIATNGGAGMTVATG